jgi:hypothetical protein
MPDIGELAAFGWVAGNYMITCKDCLKRVLDADKRAYRCRRCAGKAAEAVLEPCPISKAVADEVMRRSQAGRLKYGVTLARTDLNRKDWLQHALEEALDLACYLKRLIEMENDDSSGAN